jgi:GNAT superfamily N-acetyltransferase
VYVCLEEDDLIAYIRCKEDSGFGVYVYDLLVRKDKRGNQVGKSLIEHIKDEFKNQSIYIMSDVDLYYEKCGYVKIGSIFEV